jgi:coenzyme F420-reducing hydrogenase beta subunit
MYSQDDAIRNNAASGGTITCLLASLLETNQIDGALVLSSHIEANEVKTNYIIATRTEELIQSQGSKYVETNFTRDAVPLIKTFPGRLALVLLPCDTWVINRLRKNDPNLHQKIFLTIALFCGHISEPGLTRLVIRRNKPAGISLTDFRYRTGHWRGKLRMTFENQTKLEKPFAVFSDYQNMYFYCAKKCLHCHDHTGYDCDLSVGDVWLQAMKENPIKHNAVILRTPLSVTCIEHAIQAGKLVGHQVPLETIADAQSRSLPMHYNVSARSRAGKLLGIKISDTVKEPVRSVEFLVAFIILLNIRLTDSIKGRMLLNRLPRPILRLWLYFLKALEIL